MKTTLVIFEYLAGGILILFSIIFCLSLYPALSDSITTLLTNKQALLKDILPIILLVFIAIAYAMGIVTEFIGSHLFEGNLKEIKVHRMRKYMKKEEENKQFLSSLFKYEHIDEIKNNESDIVNKMLIDSYGRMRFFVMKKDNNYYYFDEIMSHINKLRLIRTLFLGQLILLFGILELILAGSENRMIWVILLITLSAMLFANYRAILHRFNRYCRSVEYSYRMASSDNPSIRQSP